MNIFELLNERYVLPKNPKVFEAFSGIGCQRMALNRIGIDYEMVGISEIDKYAIQSYNAIHGDTKNYGDISKIESLPEIDIFTWSFPCTDLSKAGKKKGLTNTRSGLVYEVLRILTNTKQKPKVLIMENVVDLVQTKFIEEFNEIQFELENLGYSNYVETMNAKNYGVAQNRDRVFMVSILGKYYYEFPKPIPLEKRLKDYLEEDVDEKYYLSDKMMQYVTDTKDRNGFVRGDRFNPHDEESEYAYTITTNAGQRATDNFIIIPENTIKGYTEAFDGDGVYINRPHQKRGVVQSGMIQTLKTTSGQDIGVVVPDLKRKYCNELVEKGLVDEYDIVRHSYTNNRLDNDMSRKENENGIAATLTTRPDTLGVVVKENDIITPLFILDLCVIIDLDRSEQYEKSRELLQILWREITKEEIWEEIGRLLNIYQENILQQRVHEKGVFENWGTQSNNNKLKNNSEKNKQIDIEERLLRDMWKEFKNRYTPHRWELEQQQFNKLNGFMSKLPQQTTQNEIKMLDLWERNEGTWLLQQTLSSLQKIWGSTQNEEQSKRLRIRKLSPIEVWRLMGIDDKDFEKAEKVCSNAQLYKQAGNGIVVDVFAKILENLKGQENE